MSPEVLLLYRTVLAIMGVLLFYKLSTILSRFVKNFAGHCIESVDCFFTYHLLTAYGSSELCLWISSQEDCGFLFKF